MLHFGDHKRTGVSMQKGCKPKTNKKQHRNKFTCLNKSGNGKHLRKKKKKDTKFSKFNAQKYISIEHTHIAPDCTKTNTYRNVLFKPAIWEGTKQFWTKTFLRENSKYH